jgi:hypothetical protein
MTSSSIGTASHPVLINKLEHLHLVFFLLSISAYFVGCNGMKGAPKQAEN